MNNEFIKDVKKNVKQNTQSREHVGAGRRYDPAVGVEKHNARIHRESATVDRNGKLPFTFRKPFKPLGRPEVLVCVNCGSVVGGTSATVGIICSNCGEYSKVIQFDEYYNKKED